MNNKIILIVFIIIALNISAQLISNETIILANKPKISEITDRFNENINIALMSYCEVKKLVKHAIDNYNDNQLRDLDYKILTSQYYELEPLIIKARIKYAKTPIDKAGMQCNFLQSFFLVKLRKNNYNISNTHINNNFKSALYKVVNDFPIESRDQKNVLFFIEANKCAMDVAYELDGNLDKAWNLYKNGKRKIGKQPYNNVIEKNVNINNYYNNIIQNLAINITKNKNIKNLITSVKTLQEFRICIEALPDIEFEKEQKSECLNILMQYEKEAKRVSFNNK